MWPHLCVSTASLKFRQFESAVCDAFWVFCLGAVGMGCNLTWGLVGCLGI